MLHVFASVLYHTPVDCWCTLLHILLVYCTMIKFAACVSCFNLFLEYHVPDVVKVPFSHYFWCIMFHFVLVFHASVVCWCTLLHLLLVYHGPVRCWCTMLQLVAGLPCSTLCWYTILQLVSWHYISYLVSCCSMLKVYLLVFHTLVDLLMPFSSWFFWCFMHY